MNSEIEHVVMNGHNYAIWAPDMETLLNSKGMWKYTKVVIPYSIDDQDKLVINGKKDDDDPRVGFKKSRSSTPQRSSFLHFKKDDVIGFIMTCILRDI